MTDDDVERLMHFDGIVKNRLKIKATITNARLFLAVQEEFGSFRDYTLSFFPGGKPIINHFRSLNEIPASSPESNAMSRDMKKRGFKFFGPTICYCLLYTSRRAPAGREPDAGHRVGVGRGGRQHGALPPRHPGRHLRRDVRCV